MAVTELEPTATSSDDDAWNFQLYAKTKLTNHDTKYDGTKLVEWSKRLSSQAPTAFGWDEVSADS